MVTRITDTRADVPDQRDWLYQPALIKLKDVVDRPSNLKILDQGVDGACTGFALAAAANLIREAQHAKQRVSARMLYQMARLHDEWQGENYEGSSLRGAIQGWKNMGVCSEQEWPNSASSGGLNIDRAKDARRNTLGAYYRLRPSISHYHAAINEVNVVVSSARVHSGWNAPRDGRIEQRSRITGGHAFAIVGYNEQGFWVQNSWGESWGEQGCALWRYEDWIENVMDGWAFRLALETPQIFGLQAKFSKLLDSGIIDAESANKDDLESGTPKRDRIAGHFVHVDDGRFASPDRYWSTKADCDLTAKLVAESDEYDHLMIYGHGGLNSPTDAARRILSMKEVFKDNRIYPYHVMYDTGLVDEIRDLMFSKSAQARERVGGMADWLDRMVEHMARRAGTLLWNEMKSDAKASFAARGAGSVALKCFLDCFAASKRKKKIHLIGHSTGGVLFAHLLQTFAKRAIEIESVSLLAPACSIDLYDQSYLPALQGRTKLKLNRMQVINLRDEVERDDVILSNLVYRKSLLYLVSHAFEEHARRPLLGMEIFADQVDTHKGKMKFHYSNGVSGSRSRCTSHGDFDNDPVTMNHLLRSILGKAPKRRFTAKDLNL